MSRVNQGAQSKSVLKPENCGKTLAIMKLWMFLLDCFILSHPVQTSVPKNIILSKSISTMSRYICSATSLHIVHYRYHYRSLSLATRSAAQP